MNLKSNTNNYHGFEFVSSSYLESDEDEQEQFYKPRQSMVQKKSEESDLKSIVNDGFKKTS